MFRTIIALWIAVAGFVTVSFGQTVSTRIEKIEIDKKAITAPYKVWFLQCENWVEAQRTPDGFVVPDAVSQGRFATVRISFDKKDLEFTNLPYSAFQTDWVVGIDNLPYSTEFVGVDEKGPFKLVYYIQFVNKGQETQIVVKEI